MDAERYALVKRLFAKATALHPDERAEFLEQACGNQPDLRRDVEALLQHHNARTLLPKDPKTSPRAETTLRGSSPRATSVPLVGRLPAHFGYTWLFAASACTLLVVLAGGLWVYSSIREQLLQQEAANLQAACHSATQAVVDVLDRDLWWGSRTVERWPIERTVKRVVEQSEAHPDDPMLWFQPQDAETCQKLLQELWGADVRFSVWSRGHRRIFGSPAEPHSIGSGVTETGAQLLHRVWKGESIVRLPNNTEMITDDYKLSSGVPTMGVLVPVRGEQDKIIAAMMIRGTSLERRFQEALAANDFRESGEVYAFSRDGRMLSRPRFFAEAQQLGLVQRDARILSSVHLWLRDPGGDLTAGFVPSEPAVAQPLTEMMRRSLSGEPGVNVRGYRDYRGKNVVGAWEWIDKYNFGIAAEINHREVMAPLRVLDAAFLAAALALVLSAGLLLIVTRLQRNEALLHQQRLGAYILDQPIGEGGMGTVFKARHEHLERPAAVKILKHELVSGPAIRRFTREVQCASRLEHPNTVDIFDFGCTSDGCFYYAMEFLNGVTLADLVIRGGPVPAARGIYLLKQVCGSLQEAHVRGLAHRDIKPQNIMACVCGGESDVIKVLDFGLVKATDSILGDGDTTITEWAGTPRYAAPERLLQPTLADPRSDIYSFGAVAFWLLTGHEIFEGVRDDELIKAAILESPLSAESLHEQPAELKQLVAACLEKDITARPQSMGEVLDVLQRLALEFPWSSREAGAWWRQHYPELALDRPEFETTEAADTEGVVNAV